MPIHTTTTPIAHLRTVMDMDIITHITTQTVLTPQGITPHPTMTLVTPMVAPSTIPVIDIGCSLSS